MNNIFFSIVMPAFNSSNYIVASIESVINQTHSNWELIVLDDGSTDNTLQIIEEYSRIDRRIKSFPNEINIGVSETRNRGISLSLGDWIAFLDSDDMWERDKLEVQANVIFEKHARFIFTGASFVDYSGNKFRNVQKVPTTVSYSRLKFNNVISCSSVIVEKSFFSQISMASDDMHEDYAVWLLILRSGINAMGINRPLLVYRISKNSKSGNKFKTFKMTYFVFRYIGVNIWGSFFIHQHIFYFLLLNILNYI